MLQRSSLLLLLISTLSLAQTPQYVPHFGESGIDIGAIDTGVSPCTNFYQYACGTWRAQNPIPPDKSRWGRFDELAERNLGIERDILEKSAQPAAGRSQIDKEIGDFYAACMDVKTSAFLARIASASKAEGGSIAVIARSWKTWIGTMSRKAHVLS